MYKRLQCSAAIWIFSGSLVCPASFSGLLNAQSSGQAPVKKQLPADERAFKAARANVDPEQRLAALRNFKKNYPKSNRADRADYDILKILVDTYPAHRAELDAEIQSRIKNADDQQARIDTEESIAFTLSEAGDRGIELARAEKLAKDAMDHLSEADYDKNTLAQYAKYRQPAPKPEELHKKFASARAEALAVLAEVYLREGKQTAAAPLVAEAYMLDPRTDDVNTARGRLALASHDDVLALESFERAQLLGTLAATDRTVMMQLYLKLHGGSEAGFNAEMDALYAQLFPPEFTPEKPVATAKGHTVLLELFTGSACPPCVGGDLAVEGLLEAYPRSEVVALAFDEHIPEPDPLTNPDSAARADFYDVAHTPNFVVDGELQELYGGRRDRSHELYTELTKVIDANASRPTGVVLNLSAEGSGGVVHAHATATLPGSAEIAKALSAQPKTSATSSGEKEDEPAASASAAASEPHLMVNFALVEDDIRYSGENGIRFHRMVVRSLAKPAGSGYSIEAGGTVNLDAAFDTAAISRALVSYLDGYEQSNEKFGKIKFITKDMTMQPEHLAIAAWVQDTVSRHVLQAAFVPVGSSVRSTK